MQTILFYAIYTRLKKFTFCTEQKLGAFLIRRYEMLAKIEQGGVLCLWLSVFI